MNWIQQAILTLIFLSECIKAQQKYSGNDVLKCNYSKDDEEEEPSESVLYKCNGQRRSCKTFLIFTAKFPYNTVAAISALTSSNQTEIAKINNVTNIFTVFPSGQEVIVPVNCSCSDKYYQASTTYQLQEHETYSTIANSTYQGLSTCGSLKRANNNSQSTHLFPGQNIRVPLRCACPTTEQAETGTKFLLTYSIVLGDTLYALSTRFDASVASIKEANGLSDEYAVIFAFTTILIPLPKEPLSSHTKIRGSNRTKSPLPNPVVRKSGPNRVRIIAGISAGAFSILILLILALIFLFHNKRSKITKASSQQDLILEIARFDRPLKEFKSPEIRKATGNFMSENKIMGPISNVYLGNFGGEILAVERKSVHSVNVVKVLHQVNHFNIVKLLGFCQHEDSLYLVYEHMKNGSLQKWLRNRGSLDGAMDWKRAIQIALDVANGLLYLHNFANPAYVHNNMSTTSVLLDHNLRAKISNFDHARKANCNIITRVVGIKGYIAPECLEAGPTTPKVDVFAFGGVLLELITGKYPVFMQDGGERLLTTKLDHFIGSPNMETELSRFIRPALGENGGILRYAIKVMRLSLSCLAQNPEDRPSMVEVVSILLKLQENIYKPASSVSNKTALSMKDHPNLV